ncbi:conserved hypothetical protein [Xylella fastidiosa Temecula1]|uniref:Uncharacterized protein n=1 Tax=Xylella fastidiosa (strain Temecula1 / ATCC 700964) TaxID=183190 RepID=Q87AK8_XYLFT|nr:conserved hypothetical protein [Xylella fastidiosa Temecula1]
MQLNTDIVSRGRLNPSLLITWCPECGVAWRELYRCSSSVTLKSSRCCVNTVSMGFLAIGVAVDQLLCRVLMRDA